MASIVNLAPNGTHCMLRAKVGKVSMVSIAASADWGQLTELL